MSMSDIAQLIYELTVEGFNHAEIKAMLNKELGHSVSDVTIRAGIEEAIKEIGHEPSNNQ